MDKEEKIIHMVCQALDKLYEKDSHLIMNKAINSHGKDEHHHVGERSIVFRFALYLQQLLDDDYEFSDYNLDCEYNRNGAETKALPSFPNGTYPDVILHKRGSNMDNLLVMEFKTYWNTDQSDDIRKIIEFTKRKGKYQFRLGMNVLIGKERNAVIIKYFRDGKDFINNT